MQISNNHQPNYQPNFKRVFIMERLQKAIDSGAIKGKRKLLIDKFVKKYNDSKVTVILDKANVYGKRLDAQVYYGKPGTDVGDKTYRMFNENPWLYLFGFSPKKFFEKVSNSVNAVESLCHLPKSSK